MASKKGSKRPKKKADPIIKAKADKAERRSKGLPEPAIPPKPTKPPIAKSTELAIEATPSSPVPAAGEPPKRGRSTVYTDAIASRLVELLREGKTLSSICKTDDTLPAASTVRLWASDLEHPFSAQYTRAREIGYQVWADDCVDLADNVTPDPGCVAKVHKQIETRKWILSKALPKIYGDKIALTDPDGGTFKVEFVR